MSGWHNVTLEDVEPVPTEGGTILWQPLRRLLDVGAFGINAFVAGNPGDDVIEKHDEKMLGLEEAYVVLTGRATFTLGDETLDAPAATVVFVRDPGLERYARAEEQQTTVLAIGGPRGAAYEPPAWEAEVHRAAGDFDAYADELVEALGSGPTIRGCCTSSQAPRRSPAGPTMRSVTCGVRSSFGPRSRMRRVRTTTSRRCEIVRTGRPPDRGPFGSRARRG